MAWGIEQVLSANSDALPSTSHQIGHSVFILDPLNGVSCNEHASIHFHFEFRDGCIFGALPYELRATSSERMAGGAFCCYVSCCVIYGDCGLEKLTPVGSVSILLSVFLFRKLSQVLPPDSNRILTLNAARQGSSYPCRTPQS